MATALSFLNLLVFAAKMRNHRPVRGHSAHTASPTFRGHSGASSNFCTISFLRPSMRQHATATAVISESCWSCWTQTAQCRAAIHLWFVVFGPQWPTQNATALQPSNSVPVLVNKRNHEHHEPILHCSVQKWIWIDNSNRKIQKHGIQKLGFNTQHDSMSLPPSEGLSAAQPAWIFLMAMRTGTSLASILTQSAWANGGWLEKVPGYPHFSTYQKNISGWSLHHQDSKANICKMAVTCGNSWQQHQQTPTCWRLIQSCHSDVQPSHELHLQWPSIFNLVESRSTAADKSSRTFDNGQWCLVQYILGS